MKLVIEYRYSDGDIGAYPAGSLEYDLWKGFAKNPSHKAEQIIIRPATKEGD